VVNKKRNNGNRPHFAPDPGMQRFAQNVSAAFIHLGEALEKEASGDRHQAAGSSNRHHRHKFFDRQAVGTVGAFKANSPPRWSSEELLSKALGTEGEARREEAISALKRMGLKLWERDGLAIIS